MREKYWIVLGIFVIVALALFIVFRLKSPTSKTEVKNEPDNAFQEAKEVGTSMKKTYQSPPLELSADQISGKKIKIVTPKGEIVFELFADSPKASSNFIFLTQEKFYDGLTFHRRQEGFVIQGGDPNGNGTGGPGYRFEDEPVNLEYKMGVVAMANSGPNTNGSQFFIMLADAPTLPKSYTIFGQVISGIEVVDKIQVGDVMEEVVVF